MLYKLLLFCAFYFCFYLTVFAQSNFSVRGSVLDSTSLAITGANVQLIQSRDTIRTRTDGKGNFQFTLTKSSQFLLKITCIGYKTLDLAYNVKSDGDIVLTPVKLDVDARQLDEVIIKSKAQPVLFKKDTIEYNVASYNVKDNDLVLELLKQLPGLEVDKDGNITSEGKQVTTLRVNGQDFFSGNVQEFIRQLPTGILSKVQIVNDYGDESAFTGIKNGKSTKQLNLITKPGMNNGVFGTVSLNGGSNKLLGGNLNANLWKGAKQLSTSADLKTANNVVGSNIYNKLALNYNDKLNKYLKLNSSYNYNNSRASVENSTFSESVSSLGVINNALESTAFVKNKIHTFNLSLKFEPAKSFYVKLIADISFNNSTDSSGINSQQTGLIKQGLLSTSMGSTKAPRGNAEFIIGKKFKNERRILTANFQVRNGDNQNIQNTNRIISYFNSNGQFEKDSIYNTIIKTTTHTETLDFTVTYSEPVGKRSSIDLSYELSKSSQQNALITDVFEIPLGYNRIDSLSNNFYNTLLTQKVSVSHRFSSQKLSFSDGISFQRNSLSGLYQGRSKDISQTTFNFSPILSLMFTPTTTDSYELRYAGNSEAPTIDELQPIQDVRNVQNIVIGNPNLKPSFNHQVDFNFRHFGIKSSQSLFAGLTASYRQNEIVGNTTVISDTLNTFKQVTSFVNVSGGYSIAGNYGLSIPLNIFTLKLKASYSGNVNFMRQIVFTDNNETFNFSNSISQTFRTTGRFKYLDIDGSVNYSTTGNRYTVGQGLTNRINHYTFSLSTNFKLGDKTTLGIDGNKNLISGYTNVQSNNPLIVNGSFSQLFFKNKLTVRLQATDIFNQSNKLSQIITGNTVVNNRANYITRYILISTSFNISKFGTLK